MQKQKGDPLAIRSLVFLFLDVAGLIGIYVIRDYVPMALGMWEIALLHAKGVVLAVRIVVPVATLLLVGKEWWLKNRRVAYTINRRVFMAFLFLFILLIICSLFMPMIDIRQVQ